MRRATSGRPVRRRSIALVLALLAAGESGFAAEPKPPAAAADPGKEFVARVLGATESVWHAVFKKFGQDYQKPKFVLFSDMTQGACGRQEASSGPEYCEADRKVYLDLGFFQTLQDTYGAKGDMARAYVIAHEIGHHVQKQLGILDKVGQLEPTLGKVERNKLSVRVELQADCLAGVWAGVANTMWPGMIEPGDIESGLEAAASVGSDRLQKATTGIVIPENFRHGTSKQRSAWFGKGFEAADVKACDTFGAKEL